MTSLSNSGGREMRSEFLVLKEDKGYAAMVVCRGMVVIELSGMLPGS